MSEPEIKDSDLFQLLRHGHIDEFNQRVANGESCDLRGGDFRGSDLRKLNASGLDLGDCYFRQADLRGIDFSESNLEGASISGAKISGTYFPKELRAEEILLSLTHGTRLRYMRLKINVNKLKAD
jgi:uncharacterized protein YjbI with pentapeptide repeats